MKRLSVFLLSLSVLLFFFNGMVKGSVFTQNTNSQKKDEKRFKALIKKAQQNYENFPEKSIIYGQQALEIAKKTNNKNKIAGTLLTVATAFYYNNNSDSCEKYCQYLLKMKMSGKNALSKKSYASNLISVINKNKGNYLDGK